MDDEDKEIYNGEAYDAAIDWNEPLIIYNEAGEVIYDPSNPDYFEEQMESDPGVSEEELTVTIEEVE